MIRVCNLCLEKLSKVDDDDDDDRRSIVSSSTSPFTNHQLGNELSLGLGRHPQSPYAASQLFGRKDEPFNLFSIAETKRPTSGSDESIGYSRSSTPESGVDYMHPIAAPFRRTLAVDESDPITISTTFRDSPIPGAKTPIDFPITVPVTSDGAVSSVMFPGTPEPGNNQYDTGDTAMRSRFNSYVDFDMDTPFIRSRVQSRIPETFMGEPGWRTRRESTAYVFPSPFRLLQTNTVVQLCTGIESHFDVSSPHYVTSDVNNRIHPKHQRMGGNASETCTSHRSGPHVHSSPSAARGRHGCAELRQNQEDSRRSTQRLGIRRWGSHHQECRP